VVKVKTSCQLTCPECGMYPWEICHRCRHLLFRMPALSCGGASKRDTVACSVLRSVACPPVQMSDPVCAPAGRMTRLLGAHIRRPERLIRVTSLDAPRLTPDPLSGRGSAAGHAPTLAEHIRHQDCPGMNSRADREIPRPAIARRAPHLLHFQYQPAGSDAHAHPFTKSQSRLLHPLPLNPQDGTGRHNTGTFRLLEDPRPWIT